jgi:hypothetical protein
MPQIGLIYFLLSIDRHAVREDTMPGLKTEATPDSIFFLHQWGVRRIPASI